MATTGTEFAGIMVNGELYHGHCIKVRRDTLKKIIATGKVKIVRTNLELDDTGDKGKPKEYTAAEFMEELKEPPTVSYLDMKERKIRYCPGRHIGFDITLKPDDGFVTLGTFEKGKLPLSIKLREWLRENNATDDEILDGMEMMMGMVYNNHKEENAELCKAGDILKAVQGRIAKKGK